MKSSPRKEKFENAEKKKVRAEFFFGLREGYIVSVHRMVMENRPVDPGSIQGSHRPISFKRIKHRTRANIFFFVKLGISNHIVGLVHKNHIINDI